MGKSIFCRICKKGRWTEKDSDPDEQICPRCVKKHRLDNFYGFGIALLAQYISMGPSKPEPKQDQNG